jgi:hypothetical protein
LGHELEETKRGLKRGGEKRKSRQARDVEFEVEEAS